jgi:hypothetical protein
MRRAMPAVLGLTATTSAGTARSKLNACARLTSAQTSSRVVHLIICEQLQGFSQSSGFGEVHPTRGRF